MGGGPAKRSNEAWVRELTLDPAGGAAADLRAYVRGGLVKALGRRGLDDADLDDFTQDAVVRILDKLDTFRGDSRFTTWAMAVAVRVALTALRRRRYREKPVTELGGFDAEVSMDEFEGGAARTPASALDRRNLISILHRAIRESLTERQRAAVLGELAGIPADELAGQLSMNRNALYKLHHDARKNLRRALAEAGFSAEDVRFELVEASKAS